MSFNSIQFFLFFPIVVVIYYATPHRFRWGWLLAASYYFYMSWRPEYVLLIVASTLVDYYCGLMMWKSHNPIARTRWLWLSLCINLGILFGFKYLNFFSDSVREILSQFSLFTSTPTFDILLPVGISFYTFQTLSYTIDVYRHKREPETHLGIFALYVAFFPQLVAGPIERSVQLLPQFYKRYSFDYVQATSGLRLMAWGLFKKAVIADKLAVMVDPIFADPYAYSGAVLTVATLLFAYQIYCDFSGYSDIAIGAARVIGIDLMTNFRQPYFSRSIPEFWRRWHISLSTWFRDYVYIPLGGNRVTKWRWYWNILVVFLVSGLWHGANWTFVIWGALHGLYMLIDTWTEPTRLRIAESIGLLKVSRLHQMFQIGCTFVLVCLAWIVFRANSVQDAFHIITHLHVGWDQIAHDLLIWDGVDVFRPDNRLLTWCRIIGSLLLLEFIHIIEVRTTLEAAITSRAWYLRWAIYLLLLLAIMNLGINNELPFIYFQF